jgi:predicted NAD/FAD-dependent oxidoreductase
MSIEVAIVGAGLSGLTCAQELAERGANVTVFDKGRGPGGRASTRRIEVGGAEVGFDHGAQYFTVRDHAVRPRLEAWIEAGVAARWDGRIAVLDSRGRVESYSDKPRFVGNPGMNALGRHLSRGLDVRCGVEVAAIERGEKGSRLVDREGNDLGVFSTVIVTAPPAQTSALLSSAAPEIAERTRSVHMKPCWAVMAAFESPLDVPYDGAFINDGPLSWVARTSSKPGRRPTPDRWVLHAGPEWSAEHLELDRNEAARRLWAAAVESMGLRHDEPQYLRAHRWRYAIADNPLDDGALFEPDTRIGACGDWACGNRIEGAVLSGLRMASLVSEGRRP